LSFFLILSAMSLIGRSAGSDSLAFGAIRVP
jgi:hypothetical protein